MHWRVETGVSNAVRRWQLKWQKSVTFGSFSKLYDAFLLILPVCMSLCVCVWAMLPDSNKMMTMMILSSFVIVSHRILLVRLLYRNAARSQ